MENESQCSFVRFRNPDLLRSLIEKARLESDGVRVPIEKRVCL